MNIIGCLDTADEGTYYLDGQEIEAYTEDELADIRGRKIGFVFQQFNLLPKLTAQENVELPLIYQGMSAGKRHARSEEVLERVGLLDLSLIHIWTRITASTCGTARARRRRRPCWTR